MDAARPGDDEVLGNLQGIKCEQQTLRRILKKTNLKPRELEYNLIWLARYAERLPEEVLRRLDQLEEQYLKKLLGAFGCYADADFYLRAARQLAGDPAFAQVIRAANTYRARLGYRPLGDDGWS